MIDRVDIRKIHTAPASRFGGFSFFPALFLSLCLSIALMYLYDEHIFLKDYILKVLLGSSSLLILYMLGAADDIIGVRYRTKFFFQVLSAGLIVLSGIWIKDLHGFFGIGEIPDIAGIILTIFLLVLITNSINLIDGIDGLASLLAILALAVYGTLFVIRQTLVGSLFSFASLGALIPFFCFNVFGIKKKNDSKIFMGDAGSLVIGFLLGILAVSLWNMDTNSAGTPYPSILAYTMLVIPCFDTIRVLFCRLKKRHPLFLPDNNHIHHTLLKNGHTPRKTLFAIVFAELVVLFTNIYLTGVLNITFIVLIDIFIVLLFFQIANHKSVIKIMKHFTFLFLLGILLASCAGSQKIAYFQDTPANITMQTIAGPCITVQPTDKVLISVSSKDPELAALFNLAEPHIGSNNANIDQANRLGYTVNSNGMIDFPVLGQIEIGGLTREQIEFKIKETLISENLIKDPIVTVTFSNLTFSVLGEVSRPGQYPINKDQVTILDALSQAGDLTIYGERDKIMVVRQDGLERISYQLDLRSAQIYHSPAFYIRQNDLIYVEPNKVRSNQATVNGNNVRSVSLWMSVASFLTTIGVLIFK